MRRDKALTVSAPDATGSSVITVPDKSQAWNLLSGSSQAPRCCIAAAYVLTYCQQASLLLEDSHLPASIRTRRMPEAHAGAGSLVPARLRSLSKAVLTSPMGSPLYRNIRCVSSLRSYLSSANTRETSGPWDSGFPRSLCALT